MNSYAQRVLENIKQTAPWEKEFIQSVTEVFESLGKLLDRGSGTHHPLPGSLG